MRWEASFRTRSRIWPASARGALRAGVPLLVAVAAFSCTAYAPALDRASDPSSVTPVTDMQQWTACGESARAERCGVCRRRSRVQDRSAVFT